DEIVGTTLHRLDGDLHGAIGGHHDDLDLGGDRFDGFQEIVAPHARHAEVRDHHVHRFPPHDLERVLAVARAQDLHALFGEHLGEGFEDARFVVDDEYAG